MRCEDCLPLIEEYFDGEAAETVAARVGAHLAACAGCSAALDALSFEQEIYARYDRGGLEVSPDLWSRVSAEIARGPLPTREAPRRPFLGRARESFAAVFGALAARPAHASSLALLLIGVTAGSLWLARGPQPAVQSPEMARSIPPAGGASNQPAPGAATAAGAPAQGSAATQGSLNVEIAAAGAPAADETRGARRAPAAGRATAEGAAAELDVEALLASSVAPQQAGANIVTIPADEHAVAADDAAFSVNASAPVGEAVAAEARPLDPVQKEVARHVERAQMLLRSFKNARPSEAGAPDIAYEKTLSRKLLAENSTLQLEAEVKGDKETKQVLDTIEPFLLDIANLRENPSREEVRSIRERVRKNEIVAALQVY